ncbi:hypothetical protein IF1G_04820 [Cordyceps javanica]|uniref:Uncharacterized protein n=1 Tax=Cordyceps javanica TaxID=43265 RepID=A0A545V3F2_9HYPO|nr:hypothetical protein IF1G_04820 [Cordyceps javanica]
MGVGGVQHQFVPVGEEGEGGLATLPPKKTAKQRALEFGITRKKSSRWVIVLLRGSCFHSELFRYSLSNEKRPGPAAPPLCGPPSHIAAHLKKCRDSPPLVTKCQLAIALRDGVWPTNPPWHSQLALFPRTPISTARKIPRRRMLAGGWTKVGPELHSLSLSLSPLPPLLGRAYLAQLAYTMRECKLQLFALGDSANEHDKVFNLIVYKHAHHQICSTLDEQANYITESCHLHMGSGSSRGAVRNQKENPIRALPLVLCLISEPR